MDCQTPERTSAASSVNLEQLETHVQCRLGGRVRHFRLLASAGGLILQGHAPTYYAKQLAQHAVMAATPLPIAANEIEVS
jgi:hypothetical protein